MKNAMADLDVNMTYTLSMERKSEQVKKITVLSTLKC